jgi:hypothetical protein
MASPAHVRRDHSRSFPILLLLSLTIAGDVCLGGYALSKCIAGWSRPNYFATASLLIGVATIVQFRAACCVFRCGASDGRISAKNSFRALLIGACAAYGIALAIGPAMGIGLLWAGCFALFGSLTLLPLAANSQTVERWRKLMQQAAPRRVGVAVYHAVLALVLAEALLRGYRAFDSTAFHKVAAASQPAADAKPVPAVTAARPGVLRIAIVDGLAARSAQAKTFCADALASSSTGLEISRLNRSADGTQQGNWREQLETQRPDMVLAMISLEHGLKQIASDRDAFDWRSLQTAQLVRGLFQRAPEHTVGPPDVDGPRLAICRTPLDDTAKAKWRATFAELDQLLDDCGRSGVRVALVVVPDGFQVNRVLCDTLRRRAGYEPREFDLALPQRRLATYAQERRLDMVDLLPYLQASREPVYQHAAGGWNEQGKAVASRAICGWLESQYSGLTATAQLSRGH